MPHLSGLRLAHTTTLSTDLTCNCLLPHAADTPDTRFYAAFYQLHASDPSRSDEALHSGDVAVFERSNDATAAARVTARASTAEAEAGAGAFPGVFDLTHLPRGVRLPTSCSSSSSSSSSAPSGSLLLAACTDGSARLLDTQTLRTQSVFSSIHEEMLTSATPIFTHDKTGEVEAEEGSVLLLDQLLCTAHTGAVVLYDVAQDAVVQALEGHEFDAWCSAVRLDNESSLCSGARLLFSGGDDGLLKFYDARAENMAIGKMRFDAGVVSVSPVFNTPYLLVGSYAETLALVDERFRKQPVAECSGLGGGVWRTNRLLPSSCAGGVGGEEAMTPQHPHARLPPGCVPEAGTLLVPLMQRGAALLAYDTSASGSAVFSSPLYLHASVANDDDNHDDDDDEVPVWAEGSTRGNVSEKLLVYDTAVLGMSADATQLDVATCSFYEQTIDCWTIEGLSGVAKQAQ